MNPKRNYKRCLTGNPAEGNPRMNPGKGSVEEEKRREKEGLKPWGGLRKRREQEEMTIQLCK